MSYFEEIDPVTGERSSFGGIAEAAAEYHARGELCPWDCARCVGAWWDDPTDYVSWDERTDVHPIKCGKCKQYHQDTDAVRACYARAA
jgi:hypothetical protein